jgi:RNA polymerase sigma-32 factor
VHHAAPEGGEARRLAFMESTTTEAAMKIEGAMTRRSGPRPTRMAPEEERRLSRQWRLLRDPDSLTRLVQAHIGLVIHMANLYRQPGRTMDDLIQEGYVGLVIAVRRFDPSRATRLATYASFWIRATMLHHLVRSHGPMRLGTTRSQRKIFFGLARARRKLERAGIPPDSDALARILDVEPDEIEAMTPLLTGPHLSLDAPRSRDDARQLGNTLAADGPTPEEIVVDLAEKRARKKSLSDGMKILDPRERFVLRARYMCEERATLASLGAKLGVSRERVRQIQASAQLKLLRFLRPRMRPDPSQQQARPSG